MSELTRFLEEEGKRAKVEALKATSYEAICDILDDQERQLKERNQAHLELHADYNTKHSECEGLKVQLEEEKAKTKALLVGLEVQNLDDFINRANVENYKKLGENITIGFKTQLKEQG